MLVALRTPCLAGRRAIRRRQAVHQHHLRHLLLCAAVARRRPSGPLVLEGVACLLLREARRITASPRVCFLLLLLCLAPFTWRIGYWAGAAGREGDALSPFRYAC